jgi:hypothetical protein
MNSREQIGSYIMWVPVVLYVQISVEAAAEGQKQLKFVRLPNEAKGNYEHEIIDLTAARYAEKKESQPAIDQKSIVSVWLYWEPNTVSEKIREKVHRHLERYVQNLMAADEHVRTAITDQLNGTGWYLGQNLLK